MFSLVGKESFKIGEKAASVIIESEGLSFTYSIGVNGQTLKKFIETQNKHTKTWLPYVKREPHRIVLGELACTHVCALLLSSDLTPFWSTVSLSLFGKIWLLFACLLLAPPLPLFPSFFRYEDNGCLC